MLNSMNQIASIPGGLLLLQLGGCEFDQPEIKYAIVAFLVVVTNAVVVLYRKHQRKEKLAEEASRLTLLGREIDCSAAVLAQARSTGLEGSKIESAEKLGRTGDKRAIGPLCKALTDPNPRVREAARSHLVSFGQSAAGAIADALRDIACRESWTSARKIDDLLRAGISEAHCTVRALENIGEPDHLMEEFAAAWPAQVRDHVFVLMKAVKLQRKIDECRKELDGAMGRVVDTAKARILGSAAAYDEYMRDNDVDIKYRQIELADRLSWKVAEGLAADHVANARSATLTREIDSLERSMVALFGARRTGEEDAQPT